MAEVSLELKEIKKSFTEGEAVLDNISLEISKGEFITLLGSSGCGKTTTLRIIAGLEQPDAGSVWLDGREVTGLEPNQRDVNTVFQNYALFPHMNVAENIGYGLKLKKVPKSEIRKKVSQMLELVQLEGYEKRKPSELSGGQKQRVAIARALVNNPKVLLLDEPLGALDLQLRRAMQIELKHLQKKLGITFIYITHDQEEAINMSDRIAVMKDGRIEQIGTPDEIYNHPKTSYVATFVGNANILSLSFVIGVTSWTSIAKVVRTEVRQIRNSEYIIAARCMGAGFFRILWKHLVPNFFSSIMFMVVMNVRTAMISEATLSFMGIGLPIEVITWGSMLSLSDKALMTGSWWIILIPGLFLITTVLCLTNIGNACREQTNRKESNF